MGACYYLGTRRRREADKRQERGTPMVGPLDDGRKMQEQLGVGGISKIVVP
jgi:hypothetical protein